MVVPQAESQLHPVVELEIGFAEDPVGLDLQIVGIVAVEGRREERRRQSVRVGIERTQHARQIVDREGVHIIAVLGQVIFGENAAEKEVERPVEVARQNAFDRPAGIILVRAVELQRLVVAEFIAAIRAEARIVGHRGAELAVWPVRNDGRRNRREISRRSWNEGRRGRGQARRNAVRRKKCQRIQAAGIERTVADIAVVVLHRVQLDPLVLARNLQRYGAEIMLDFALQRQFAGEILRRERRIHRPRVRRDSRVRIDIRPIEAAERESGRDALGRQEFLRRQCGGEGRVAVERRIVEAVVEAAEDAGRIALAELLLDTRAIVLFMEIGRHQVDGGVGRRLPAQRTADRVEVTVVDAIAEIKVLRIAVAVQINARDADGGGVAERDVDHPFALDRIIIAIFAFGRGFERVELGLGGNDVDHARCRVAAEQRSLRAAQHFDAFEVEKFRFKKAGRKEGVAVEVDRGRAVAGRADAKIADAANRKAGAGEVRLGEGDVRQRELKVRRRLDLLRFKRFGRKGADGNRNVLQTFGLALRGDDDFAIGVGAGAAALRMGGRCHCHGQDGRSNQCLELHLFLPFSTPQSTGSPKFNLWSGEGIRPGMPEGAGPRGPSASEYPTCQRCWSSSSPTGVGENAGLSGLRSA